MRCVAWTILAGVAVTVYALPESECPKPECICTPREATKTTQQHVTAMCSALPSRPISHYISRMEVRGSLQNVTKMAMITIIASITEMSLSRCDIGQIEDDSFSAGLQLTKLDLSHNNIAEITQNTFGLVPKLTELHLENNNITHIADEAFEKLHNLNDLYLHGNHLKYIPKQLPTKLVNLDLTSNIIGPHISALNQSQLRNLQLCDNVVQQFDVPHLPLLHSLCLGGSANLPATLAEHVPSIANLSLVCNRSTTLHPTSQAELARMETLTSLTIVKYSTNSLDFLQNLTRLTTLRLEYLTLTGKLYTKRALSNKANLTHLYLDGSSKLIGELLADSALLHSFTNLLVLSLRNTGLTAFAPANIPDTQTLHLDISHNTLHCDCSMKWLQQKVSQLLSVAETECATPTSARGKLLTTVINAISCSKDAKAIQKTEQTTDYSTTITTTTDILTQQDSHRMTSTTDSHLTLYIVLGCILALLIFVGIVLAMVYIRYKRRGLQSYEQDVDIQEPSMQQLQQASSEATLLEK